jgi:hypothetical protein
MGSVSPGMLMLSTVPCHRTMRPTRLFSRLKSLAVANEPFELLQYPVSESHRQTRGTQRRVVSYLNNYPLQI